jgi:hypothetical protein
LDEIVSGAWQTAARLNPMSLVKLNPDLALQHLRCLINDCLTKGMTPKEISDYVVQELLGSYASTPSCTSALDGRHGKQVSS